jgi:dTDP-4-dehydrorhamnose reductase
MSKSLNFFIVGAMGYIGNTLIKRAKKKCHAYGTTSSGAGGFLPLCLDAPSDFDYGKFLPGDVVLFTAAISAPDICAHEYDRAWAVNVTGTSAFISKVIERGARVIFFSSDTVYGELSRGFEDGAECSPAGEYAEMKCEVERRFAGNPAFKSIRLSYVFSCEDKFTKYLLGCNQKNEEADLFHPFFRSIVHRDDVIEGALNLAMNWDNVPEQFINFGGPEVISRINFAECLREVCMHDLRFKVTEPESEFFKNRPRIIAMKSPIFSRLLGRMPHTLSEAAYLEFLSSKTND